MPKRKKRKKRLSKRNDLRKGLPTPKSFSSHRETPQHRYLSYVNDGPKKWFWAPKHAAQRTLQIIKNLASQGIDVYDYHPQIEGLAPTEPHFTLSDAEADRDDDIIEEMLRALRTGEWYTPDPQLGKRKIRFLWAQAYLRRDDEELRAELL